MLERLIRMSLFGGETWRPTWLLRDDFLSERAAGTLNGTPAEPGPGTRLVVDTGSLASISGGRIVFSSGPLTPGDPRIGYPLTSRVAGRTCIVKGGDGLDNPGSGVEAGFDVDQSGSLGGSAFRKTGMNTVGIKDGTSTTSSFFSMSPTLEYLLWVVLRSAGAFYFVQGGDFSVPTLVWVAPGSTTGSLYPAAITTGRTFWFETIRMADLPEPFDSDFGIATQRLAGERAAGDPFTHEADGLIEWTQTSLPVTGESTVRFRNQDGDNNWTAAIASSGDFILYERVNGVLTARASAAGVVESGHRCVLICDGRTIRGYSNNTVRWSYLSADNFLTMTGGILFSPGTGGAVSNLVSWPRRLAGRAKSILETAAK